MLALIAGRGALPGEVLRTYPGHFLVCALKDQPPSELVPDLTFRLESIGSFVENLRERGVRQVCMAGAIERPGIDPAQIDERTLPLVPRILAALSDGDDGALRAVIGIFEDAGFEVVAAHDLAPDLLAGPGVLSQRAPSEAMSADAAKGFGILASLSPWDVGQACVIGAGQMLGCEGIGGTAHMLATLPRLPQTAHGVLVKGPKLGQDRRADMPTIGPETAAQAREAGLAGIVLRAGGVLLLEREATLRTCDEAGMALWVLGDD